MQAIQLRNWTLRGALVMGVSAIAFAGGAVPAFAADAGGKAAPQDSTVSEVVVTGIRGSLQKSLDIKRTSLGVVDAISSEDIGKFPDSNLAAALQRIPGVSVSRGTSSVGGVPTSTGAATEITVRGFGPSFNETLFDGRKVATPIGSTSTTNTRGFDFSSVGADFVGEVNILKTPDSELSDGAIGATINIKFPKPFDHPGLQMAATASGSIAPEQGSITPKGGALISDTFGNNRIGVLVDFYYSDDKTKTNHINTQGWEGTTFDPVQFGSPPAAPTNGWFIQDYGIYQEHTEDRRYDGRAVLQFRPTDNIEVTINDNYARDKIVQDQYGYSVWFNGNQLQNITLSPNGSVTNFVQRNTPTDFQSQVNGSVIELNEIGANVTWDLSDSFKVTADYDHSLARLNPGGQLSSIDADVGYGPSPNGTNGVDVGITGVAPGAIPYPTASGPGGDSSKFINNGLIGSHVVPISSQQNRDQIDQFRIGGQWQGDHVQLKFGFDWLKDDKDLSAYDSFANNDWQAYAGYGPASNNPGGVALNQAWFTNSFSTRNFVSGFANGDKLPSNVLVFDPYTVVNYLQSLGNPQTTNIPGANKNCCTPPFDGTYRIILNDGGFLKVSETVYSVYLNLSGDAMLGGMELKYNVGLRAEDTEVTSQGLGQQVTGLTVQPSDHTAFLVAYDPNVATVTANNSYRNLLPNLDLSLGLTDTLKLRFDASRTLTRAPLNYLTPVSNIPGTQRVGALVATGGNPNLKPYTSDNLDLGLEWYYARNSYIAIDGFAKEVNDFIVGGTVQGNINGVIDPTTGQKAVFSITSQVNGPAATVYGVEASIQHVFGDSGFGVQANGTIVATNRPYHPNDITTSGFAVTGLANSANAVVFWEKYGFSLRGALNWRGEYIDHFGQQQNNSHFGAEPTFVNSNLQVDLSASYTLKDHYTIFVEGLNVNNSTYSTHGRFSDQLLDAIEFGPRVTFGVRAKF